MTRRHTLRSAVISALLFASAGCATQASAPTPAKPPPDPPPRAAAVPARRRCPIRSCAQPLPKRAPRSCAIPPRSTASTRPTSSRCWPAPRSATASSPRCRGRPKPSRGATTGRSSSPSRASTAAAPSSPSTATRSSARRTQYGVPAEVIVVDHRRGNQLRQEHRQLSGARRAVHAGLRLSAHRRPGQGRSREPPRGVLPRRARPAVRARQGNRPGHHHAHRQLRRRDGLGPVHAVELPRVRRGRRRRRQARPVQQPRRRVRLDRQLLRQEGRLGARRPGHGARQRRRRCPADSSRRTSTRSTR